MGRLFYIQTIADAGAWGMDALDSRLYRRCSAGWVHRYYNTMLNAHRLADYPTNPNIAIVNGFMCAETDEEALEKAAG